jgi:hypothetical protein
MPTTSKHAQATLLGKVVKRFSFSSWVFVIKTLNALANMRGENGISITKSDAGYVISTRREAESSSTGMIYQGEFDEDGIDFYNPGDVVRVSDGNSASSTHGGPTVPGVYVCIAQPGEDDYPRHPLQDGGETAFWNWLSTWPSSENGCVDGTPAVVIRDSQVKPEESE